ncbi:MAG: beta-lactamase family protein [Spirochaetaceae bacterium]|jgi:CubicO group peptidase (beta-lactamase class C family)|nr:beta-lactamase family protein [Spirochaetaceae bacterium]
MNKFFVVITSISLMVSCATIDNKEISQSNIPIEERIAKTDRLLSGFEENESLFGSILIKKDGEILYQKTLGYRDIVDGNPIYADNQTKYRIGSITKTYTSAMIHKAIEAKLLRHDTTLDTFFPLIQNAEKITIQDMLYHRSGLYNITSIRFSNTQDMEQMYTSRHTRDDLLEMIYSLKHRRPNTRTEYSNTNYVLLGFILEDLYQKPYQDLVKEMITDVIGLNNTSYAETITSENNESRSFSFTDEKGYSPSMEANLSWAGGAGSLISTTEDLALFYEALFNGTLLTKDSLEHMTALKYELRAPKYELSRKVILGMGIWEVTFNGNRMFHHGGYIDDCSSIVLYDPNEKVTIVFIVNGSSIPYKGSITVLNRFVLKQW